MSLSRGHGGRLGVWPPLPPAAWLRRPAPRLPFPLEEPGCRVLAWARHGLWHGARALGLGPGDQVLVPAYHHGSEIEALARAGLDCRFYAGSDLLEPQEDELERLIGPRTRALHVTHFFGFVQDAARWRRFCDQRGLLLIEDAAQAWLSVRDGRPAGSLGDLAIFCMYKTVGLPEGAAMLTRVPVPEPRLDRRPGVHALARKQAAWLSSRSLAVTRALEPLRRPRPFDAERDQSLRDPDAMPWSSTRFVLRRLAREDVAARRRANYLSLLDALADRVPAPFRSPSPGASPFLLPIETNEKAAVVDRLRRFGVDALDVWSVPHRSLPEGGFADARARRARTVGLPVHQELRPRDLERIAAAVG